MPGQQLPSDTAPIPAKQVKTKIKQSAKEEIITSLQQMHTEDIRQREVMLTNLNSFFDYLRQFMTRTLDQRQEMIDILRRSVTLEEESRRERRRKRRHSSGSM